MRGTDSWECRGKTLEGRFDTYNVLFIFVLPNKPKGERDYEQITTAFQSVHEA